MTSKNPKTVDPIAAKISIRVTPRASRDSIERWDAGVLYVKTVSPPVDNAANASCCELVARLVDVGRRSVEVVSGQRSRNKTLLIAGISQQDLEERLRSLKGEDRR